MDNNVVIQEICKFFPRILLFLSRFVVYDYMSHNDSHRSCHDSRIDVIKHKILIIFYCVFSEIVRKKRFVETVATYNSIKTWFKRNQSHLY